MKKNFNSRLIIISLVMIVLMSFVVYAGITITQNSPGDGTTNASRSINFTFTPVWVANSDDVHVQVGNCTLFTNFTGTWQAAINNDSTNAVITNNSLSWINYTFADSEEILFNWAIRCFNATINATPLYNFSSNRSLTIDTSGPITGVNSPSTSLLVSTFVPNISVKSDVSSCKYILNITDSTKTTASSNFSTATSTSNNLCLWDAISFKDGVYNITFNATDALGNQNMTSVTFTVLDGASSNDGTTVATSSITSSSAVVTVSNVNESVNLTVNYGTSISALDTGSATYTSFAASPTATLSSLSLNTVYFYNVTLCDYNGNCITNATVFNFTTIKKSDGASCSANSDCTGGYCCDDECSSSECSSSTTTSGSSGGGVSASASTVTSNIAASKSKMWGDVTAGESFSLDVDKTDIAVTKVTVNVKNDLSNVELKASSLKENPVSYGAGEKTYQYLEIKDRNIKDADFEGTKIRFRVQSSWLGDNNINKEDIALYRYKDGEWNILDTKEIAGNNGYVHYEATAPGFSYFAIASKSSETKKQTTEQESTDSSEETEPEKEATKTTSEPAATPIQDGSNATGLIIFLVIVVLGGGAYYFVMNKDKFIKKKKK